MTIDFYKETFASIINELPPLFVEHFRIIKDTDYKRLDINWAKYQMLEDQGLLHILTARNGNSLVGYWFNFVMPHILYDDIPHGFSDIYFLLPAFRRGYTGLKMIKENAKMLQKLGVKKQIITINEGYKDILTLFAYLGYQPFEHSVTKRIG